MTSFRPYQLEDFESIVNNYQNGMVAQLVIQATGLGKTRMMAGIPSLSNRLALFGKTLVLVNRIELARQTMEEFLEIDPTLRVGIEQGENTADDDVDVLIISVQTMGTAKFDENGSPIHKPRLLKIDPWKYDKILVDETHRAPANTFRSILMYMGVYRGLPNYRPYVLLLGFTATPNRADNKGLEEFYECICLLS